MVLKLPCNRRHDDSQFESDVISDGTQTEPCACLYGSRFESDVISDGTQTQR